VGWRRPRIVEAGALLPTTPVPAGRGHTLGVIRPVRFHKMNAASTGPGHALAPMAQLEWSLRSKGGFADRPLVEGSGSPLAKVGARSLLPFIISEGYACAFTAIAVTQPRSMDASWAGAFRYERESPRPKIKKAHRLSRQSQLPTQMTRPYTSASGPIS
jgi:hypothetical protein